MKIAIPTENGRLHGHFGGCRLFALVEVDSPSGRTMRTEWLPAPDHLPGLFPRWLGQLGVDVVIADGIGQRALDLFARQGIDVRPGVRDASVQQLVAALLEGRLTGSPSGCNEHQHQHQHGHGHGHGDGHGHRAAEPAGS